MADLTSFIPDLSDNNPDEIVQAYLHWRDLKPPYRPSSTLMFGHFNWFLEQELQFLLQ